MPQRDANGRFIKGHTVSKGKGRPPKKREERYYEILVSSVTFEQWQRIVKKAAQQAERGDATARKWLADYIVGVPQQNVNLSGSLALKDARDYTDDELASIAANGGDGAAG